MKKIAVFVLALLLVMSLTACEKKPASPTPTNILTGFSGKAFDYDSLCTFIEYRADGVYFCGAGDEKTAIEGVLEALNSTSLLFCLKDVAADGVSESKKESIGYNKQAALDGWKYKVTLMGYTVHSTPGKADVTFETACTFYEIYVADRYVYIRYDDGSELVEKSAYAATVEGLLENIKSVNSSRLLEYSDGKMETDLNKIYAIRAEQQERIAAETK